VLLFPLGGQIDRLIDRLGNECLPSTLRMLIWLEASTGQKSMAAVSADGGTVCGSIRRLNSSYSRLTALVVRTLRHSLGGSCVEVKSRLPASWRLWLAVPAEWPLNRFARRA
jgi:hypothetical protein